MPIDTHAPRAPGGRAWTARDTGVALLLGLAAAALLAGAGRDLVRELHRIPANGYYETHEDRLPDASDAGRHLGKAIELYRHLPAWVRGAEEQRRLGGLLLMDLQRRQETGADAAPLDPPDGIDDALAASLAQAPAHPLTWAYLADAGLTRGGDPASACRTLKQSYRVAPVEPDFFFYRLGLALDCQDAWDAAFLGLIRPDIASVFPEAGANPNTGRFIETIKSNPRLATFVGGILKSDEAVFQRYEKAVR